MAVATAGAPLDVRNLREFLRDLLHEALVRQRASLDDHTEACVVNLLTMFSRSDALFEPTPLSPHLRPLALMLADAAEATSAEHRTRNLQRLGDVSLFIAGTLRRLGVDPVPVNRAPN